MTNISTPTIPVRAAAESAATPVVRPPLADTPSAGLFDGLHWTIRNGFDRVLARVPARAWCDPASQGWERIKHNGSRDVWRARIGDQVFYLKYYYCRGFRATLKRWLRGPACIAEWRTGIYTLEHGIDAVRPAGYTPRLRSRGGACSLLVTEAAEPSHPLDAFWRMIQSDPDVARRRADTQQLIERLAQMIARAHQAGFEHLDMHASNILVQPIGPRQYRTLFVDLHTARMGVALDARALVRNLAQLNQWFRRHSSVGDRLRFLRAYFRWRNEFEHRAPHGRPLELTFEQLVRALVAAAARHADRLWSQRDRRAARRGRYFSPLRLPDGWRGLAFVRCKHALDESPVSKRTLEPEWWRERLADPLTLFRGDSCKNSHSAQVTRVQLPHPDGEISVIVKRPRARNWRRRLAMMLAPSRSLRGWRIGHAMLHRDIAVARPLAVLERRAGPVLRDSLLITEAVPNAQNLEEHLRRAAVRLPAAAWTGYKRKLARLLVRHLRQLEDRGFAHRDCKASNILVVDGAGGPKLLWIDMDGLRPAGALSRARRAAPLMRLHVSLESVPGLTRTDRARFLRDYCARFGSRPDAWRELWRRLEAPARRKRAAKETRRQWKLQRYGRE